MFVPIMQLVQRHRPRKLQRLYRDLARTGLKSIAVDELVGEEHDILVHAILLPEVDDRGGVGVRETFEEADVEALVASVAVPDLEDEHMLETTRVKS